MDNLQSSLENLINTNNGKYKSEKQKDFIFTRSSYEFHFKNKATRYIIDKLGVVSKTIEMKLIWERPNGKDLPIQTVVIVKQLKRKINALNKSIKNRENSKDSYVTDYDKELYNTAMNADLESLNNLELKLKEIK